MVIKMDHNLEDSLNLESAIGEMDFDHAGDVVVSQADITLDTRHEGGMSMEFEHIEEQPMLMDSGNEAIIVSDFMSDQFSLQEYSVQDDQTTTATTTEESNTVMTSQADPLIHLQFDSQQVVPMRQEASVQPKFIAIKAAPVRAATATGPVKKLDPSIITAAPRQIAIAPKPPKLVPTSKAFPIALVSNKSGMVKKVPLSGVLQSGSKGNTVLAQIGKQLVMMPSGHQKIKLVTSGSSSMSNVQYIKTNSGQTQLITAKSGLQAAKPIMAKVIVQGQSNVELGNQQTVITKILPSTSAAAPQARYVMQQKTVPISLGNKVLLASPTKQGMKFTKKQQIIAIKSPTPKLMPAPAQAPTTKKVVISANPNQNVILKTTAPPKTAQVTKDGKVVMHGQKSQLHQINVPGKGIQYIRLITNQSATAAKTVAKPQTSTIPSKQFVLTDNKGNLIQMSAEKVISGQPPPLVFTGNAPAGNKWQQKLVRIAAAPPKTGTVTSVTARSAQSLLAPLSSMNPAVKVEDPSSMLVHATEEVVEEETEIEENDDHEYATVMKQNRVEDDSYAVLSQLADARGAEAEAEADEVDSKAALRALIADAVAAGDRKIEVTYEPETQPSPEDDMRSESMSPLEAAESLEEQLIVIPSNYMKADNNISGHGEYGQQQEGRAGPESDAEGGFLAPRSPLQASECDVVTSELGLRPRRACNCTKSQCLKLYCDCFANGEFCNRCNCTNCYNNLNYEELRQKAIRACLERNPNAFRPKIGKSKTGGPEIIRRHNKGCNCKRSGCLKNYCECYEAKIACTSMCKCFGCRNVEETLHRARRRAPRPAPDPSLNHLHHALYRPPPTADVKQPCSFMTSEVIEAVCQCLLAAGVDEASAGDPVRDVLDEFSRCLQDVIAASHHAAPEGHT